MPGKKYQKKNIMKTLKKHLNLLAEIIQEVIEYLKEKMMQASESLAFEEAAGYRDLISSVKKMSVKQKVTDFNGQDRDIIALARTLEEAVVQVFLCVKENL